MPRRRNRSGALFTPAQHELLASLGQTPQEIYDFADDHIRDDGDPDWETYLLISAARRDYFLAVQNGEPSGRTVSMDDLPAKDAKLDGIPWLPRVIKKAEAKLRGEMPADLMYNCGGDRNFFREHGISSGGFPAPRLGGQRRREPGARIREGIAAAGVRGGMICGAGVLGLQSEGGATEL